MTEIQKNGRKLFFFFLVSGLLLGLISAAMFYIGAKEKNLIPTLIGAAASLGTVALLGFSVKNFIKWVSN